MKLAVISVATTPLLWTSGGHGASPSPTGCLGGHVSALMFSPFVSVQFFSTIKPGRIEFLRPDSSSITSRSMVIGEGPRNDSGDSGGAQARAALYGSRSMPS